MSIDPETERQIAELSHDPRPLLVLDVDDVVLHFVRPFPRFLEARGFDLKLGSFKLLGNMSERATGRLLEREEIAALVDEFFHAQADWQTITDGAAEVLADFAPRAEIVMLTAMPHRYRAARRAHMDALGLNYPLLTTEMAKGPAIAKLRGDTPRPIAFVDDQPTNLESAREFVPDVKLFHLMAETNLRELLPDPPPGTHVVDDWAEARPLIAAALGI
jgi:hypothetical protein